MAGAASSEALYVTSPQAADVPMVRSLAPASGQAAHTSDSAITKPGAGRVALIDVARGLFIFWMITVHALSLANVRTSSVLAWVIPPPGLWLSERFVVLTGFTVAWLFAERALLPGGRWILYRRAIQIGSIAYLSNLASFVIVDVVDGRFGWPTMTSALIGTREWSISAILLPTTVLLLISPWLLALGQALGAGRLLVLATIAGLLSQGMLRDFDPSGLMPIVLLGAWGLALALWARRFSLAGFAAVFSFSCLIILLSGDWLPVPAFFAMVARFGVFFGAGALLSAMPLPPAIPGALARFGRNALLIFVAHRLCLQGMGALFGSHLDPDATGLLLTTMSVAAMVAMCAAREASPAVSSRLKAIGL